MKSFFEKFVKFCPKTGKIRKIILPKGYYRLLFPIVGFAALIWILLRVIPKPSRASYPCVKTATPFATSFILWIIGLTASVSAFSKMKLSFTNSSYIKTFLFLILGIVFGVFAFSQEGLESFAGSQDKIVFKQAELEPNQPMGEPVGINPGRVVWVHDADATNENCDPMAEGQSYFEPENTNQNIVDAMLSEVIQSLTGTTSNSAAWEAIFKFHNNKRGKGEVGYQTGEKIFLKLNATSAWWGNYNDGDLSKVYSSWGGVNGNYGLSETTPQIMKAVLRQLINVVHVPQEDIYIGDPMKFIYKHIYEYLNSEFPNIHYLDHTGHTDLGRELAEKGTTPVLKYSDRGTVLVDVANDGVPVYEDKLYKIYEEMEYMLNLPQMKGHIRGGVTMFAKNHFGSHTRDGANHLHNGLMDPGETGLSKRPGYGLYRVQVDIMGHEILGGKNLFYIMDALWGTHHELANPHKWQMAPFNNDWTSSIFASFDPVAIESVGYDFVRTEFTHERYPEGFVFYNGDVVETIQAEGVCDYLRQAADSSNWPEGIQYDPENDGTVIGSQGVHEHWNNDTDKEYSKNLGTGDGIELVKIEGVVVSVLSSPSELSGLVSNDSDVQLSWKDHSDAEEGFIIERKENSENSEYIVLDTVAADQTIYLDQSDKLVSSYYYRVKAYNTTLTSEYTEPLLITDLVIVSVDNEIIASLYKLNQNYPNPFNPNTNIDFSLQRDADVSLKIYDSLGRLVKIIIDKKLTSGNYSYTWNSDNFSGSKVGSGIYIYKITLNIDNKLFSESRKMIMVK